MIKKLLILSDNHGDLNEMVQIIKHEHADLVVHAGDYNLPISTMKQYFNYFVDGNNDYGHVRQVSFNFANKKFLLLHGDEFWTSNQLKWHSRLRDIGKQQGVDFIIYGHSHIPIIDESSKPILVNPGSISLPRSENMQKTYMIIEFNGTEANIKIEPCIR